MMELSGNFRKNGGIDKIWKVQLGLGFFKCTLYLCSYMISTTICVNRLSDLSPAIFHWVLVFG